MSKIIGYDKYQNIIREGDKIQGFRYRELKTGIIYYCLFSFEYRVKWEIDNTFSSLRETMPFEKLNSNQE